jgi:hypothetical protein
MKFKIIKQSPSGVIKKTKKIEEFLIMIIKEEREKG